MRSESIKKRVFDILIKGGFICQNSINKDIRLLYTKCESNYIEYVNYFLEIGFSLEKGDGFFYFVKEDNLPADTIDEKLAKLVKFINHHAFLLAYDSNFGVGYLINIKEIALKLDSDISLKNSFKNKKALAKSSSIETIESIVNDYMKFGFVEEINSYEKKYKVVDSYNYFEEFIESIIEMKEEEV